MQLYHFPSPNPQKVTFALKELGLDCEIVPIDLAKGEQRQATFLAVNPAGRAPVLVDGELTLPESHAILSYLGEKTGRLWPPSASRPRRSAPVAIFFRSTSCRRPATWRCASAPSSLGVRSTKPLSNAAKRHCQRHWRSSKII
jgi:glutathione S-transferase